MSSTLKNNKKLFTTSTNPSMDSRIAVLENNEFKVTYFTEISSNTGTITVPTNATILTDQFAGGVDAYVSTISSGEPTGINPTTSGGSIVDVSSFDSSGNYTLTGIPGSYPVALVYVFKIKSIYWSNVTLSNIVSYDQTLFALTSSYIYNEMFFQFESINFADATTYFFDNLGLAPNATESARGELILKENWEAYHYEIIMASNVAPTTENSTLYLREDSTTDYQITNTFAWAGGGAILASANGSFSQQLTSNKKYKIKITTASWVTNPTSVRGAVRIFLRKQIG